MGTWNRANDVGDELGIGKQAGVSLEQRSRKKDKFGIGNKFAWKRESGEGGRNTVEDMWALGTINKQERDELGNGKCGSGLEKEGDEKNDPGIGER